MSSTQTQIRRGTAAQVAAMTPASSEVIHETTNNRLHVGNGLRAGGFEIPNFSDIQKQAFNFGTAGGTADAITLTLAPVLLAYTAGVAVEVLITANNTGAATLNVNTLGTVTIKKESEGTLADLEADDLVAGGIYRFRHNGTYFIVSGISGSGTKGWELLAVASGGGATYDFTSDISTDYGVYAFLIKNLTPVTSSALRMRTKRSGVGSFDTDANYTSVATLSQTGMTINRVASGTSMRVVPNVLSLSASGTAFGVHGSIMAFNLGNSGRALFDGSLMADADYVTKIGFGGNHATGTAIDGVRFFFESGNIASGEIYLYGVQTSL